MTSVPVMWPWDDQGAVTAESDGTDVVLRVTSRHGGALAKLDPHEVFELVADLLAAMRDVNAGRVTQPRPTG